MATKRNAQSFVRNELEKSSADAVLGKVDQLARENGTTDDLEEILRREIEAHIEANITPALSRGVKGGADDAVKAIRPTIKGIKGSVPPPVRKGSK